MAKTKTVSDAITRAQNEFKGITLATTDSLDFANEVNEIILKANMWDFMSAQGGGFGTTDGTQDYSNLPSDFLSLKSAWIRDDSDTNNIETALDIKDALPVTFQKGKPRAISVEDGAFFRLLPVPNITRSGSGQWLIDFEYFKLPVRLTAVGNTFSFDDAHFETFAVGFTARVGEFLDMQQAGRWLGRNERGKFRGTGLWGKFAGMLNDWIGIDNRTSGSPVFAPEERLFL